jgi:lipoyl(octanoyl) transferase
VPTLSWIRLGHISYDNALKRQEETINRYRISGEGLPVIFSLEHSPVVTCGRSTNYSNLLLSEPEYSKLGIDLRKTDRGGDVTYHGPGQVVVYPIVDLRKLSLRPGEYVTLLENAMIATCHDYGVQACHRDGMHGCWTDAGKIGATGTAVKSGGITKHGIAFNVRPDLSHFSLIVPCGISKYPVARLDDLIEKPADLDEVETRLVDHIALLLRLEIEKSAPGK